MTLSNRDIKVKTTLKLDGAWDYELDYESKGLSEDSFTMCIDSFSETFEPIVHIIPNFYNNHRITNLFEAKVDKGKLLVCLINLDNNAVNGKKV